MDRCMINIKKIFLFSSALMSFDTTSAEKLTVYRWVDDNDVVHFSQHQPTHDNFTEISMTNNVKSPALLGGLSHKNTANNTPAPEDAEIFKTQTHKKCTAAQKNLTMLQDFDKIQFKDEKGNMRLLSELEKQQQLAMNTKQAEVYCTDK